MENNAEHSDAERRRKNRENMRRWRAANRERDRENSRRFEARNKEKRNAKNRKYYHDNKESETARNAAYYHANKEREAELFAQWRAKNLRHDLERRIQWSKENPGKDRLKYARRRAALIQATPAWVSWEEIQAIYVTAALLSETTSIHHDVDHIVPLLGKNVCGLHVPWNLRVIPASQNRSKGNRIDAALMLELERRYAA